MDTPLLWPQMFLSDSTSTAGFIAYFLVLGASLLRVVAGYSLWTNAGRQEATVAECILSIGTLGVLSVIAFGITWRLIFRFFDDEAALWLSSPSTYTDSTFVKAYELVTTPCGYFWSSQLLMWVIPGCIFLQTECSRHRSHLPWVLAVAYTGLGFLGAISLSFPLFFAHLILLRTRRPRPNLPPKVSLLQVSCATLAVLAVIVLPVTVHKFYNAYVVALTTLHVVLAVPSVVGLISEGLGIGYRPTLPQFELHSTYIALGTASAVVQATNMATAVAALAVDRAAASWLDIGEGLVASAWQNSCQSSISFDVLFTTLACALFVGQSRGRWSAIVVVVASPFCSIGFVFSAFLAVEAIDDNAATATTNAMRAAHRRPAPLDCSTVDLTQSDEDLANAIHRSIVDHEVELEQQELASAIRVSCIDEHPPAESAVPTRRAASRARSARTSSPSRRR